MGEELLSRRILAFVAITLLVGALVPIAPVAAADPDYFVTPIPGSRLPLSNATSVSLPDNFVTSGIPIGFRSFFFGRSIDTFWIGSNGFVTLHFLTPDGCCEGAPLPTPGGPDGMIAGWWTDLDPSAGGNVSFERTTLENQSALVVDFDRVRVANSTATASFQVILLQNGVFEIRIANATSNPGRFVSVGAEDINGQRGIEQVRELGATRENVGFRFEPNIPPTPPPVIQFLNPPSGSVGTFVDVFGDNFLPGARVLLGGVEASSDVRTNTSLFFFVPPLPTGFHALTIRNPDGNETTVFNAFEVTDFLSLNFASPNPARQGDVVSFFGSAFNSNVTFLVGNTPLETESVSPNVAAVRLPPTFRPGLYSIGVFDPQRGSRSLLEGLLVLGRPDLSIVDVHAERPAIGTFATPGVPLPQPWNVEVSVTNSGDLTARNVMIDVEMSRSGGIVETRNESFFELRPGETTTLRFSMGNGLAVGDHEFTARASAGGIGDRDLANNEKTTTSSAYVSGVGGVGVGPIVVPDPCTAVPRACMTPSTVTHRNDERDQTDIHTNAFASLNATMKTPDFDFSNFSMVFTTFTPFVDGGFRECTTWRFLDDATGTFRVTMSAQNGLAGVLFVPFAETRTSNGTARTTTHEDTRAFDVILTETEPQTGEEHPSEPISEYEYSRNPSATWSFRATGLRGDFTHCANRPATSAPSDEFTYAQLPDDTDEPIASFSGFGHADKIVVRFIGTSQTETSRPFP